MTGDYDVVVYLWLDCGSAKQRDVDMRDVLLAASHHGRVTLAGAVLDGGANPTAVCCSSYATLIARAAAPGHASVVRLLVARGASAHGKKV